MLLAPCPGVRVQKSDRARALYPDFPCFTTLFRAGSRLPGTVCGCGGEGAGLSGLVFARAWEPGVKSLWRGDASERGIGATSGGCD